MAATWARMSRRRRAPISRTRARLAVMRAGAPQLDLRDGPEEVMADRGREDVIEVARGSGARCAMGSRGNITLSSVWFLQAGAEDVLVEGAVDGEQAADAGEVEAERQRDRLEALGGDDDEQREAAGAIRQLVTRGRSLDRDGVLELSVRGPGVLALTGSKRRNPPPVNLAALIDTAAPEGGLNPRLA